MAVKSKVKVEFSKKHAIIAFIALLFLIVAAVPGIYFYIQYKNAQEKLLNPSKQAESEIQALISRVEKHVLLPSSEIPTLATVSDVSKLQKNKFFANAQNGDKVLIYSKAKKAVLYRPSTDRVVEISVLELAEQTPATPTPGVFKKQENKVYKVAILNGSTTAGLGGKIQEAIESKIDNITVGDVVNASQKTYLKTIVVDMRGNATDEAMLIAKTIGGTVTNTPYSEKPPKDADIVIVIGSDKNTKTTPTKTPTVEPTDAP